jgi:hypothetical protein
VTLGRKTQYVQPLANSSRQQSQVPFLRHGELECRLSMCFTINFVQLPSTFVAMAISTIPVSSELQGYPRERLTCTLFTQLSALGLPCPNSSFGPPRNTVRIVESVADSVLNSGCILPSPDPGHALRVFHLWHRGGDNLCVEGAAVRSRRP